MKFGLRGALLGFSVALCLAGIAYLLNSYHVPYNLDELYIALAPTSLILMLTENATPSAQALIVLIFGVQNAIIYGLLGLLAGKVCGWISK